MQPASLSSDREGLEPIPSLLAVAEGKSKEKPCIDIGEGGGVDTLFKK